MVFGLWSLVFGFGLSPGTAILKIIKGHLVAVKGQRPKAKAQRSALPADSNRLPEVPATRHAPGQAYCRAHLR